MGARITRAVLLLVLVSFNAFVLSSGLHSRRGTRDAATSHGSDDGRKQVYIVFTERQPSPASSEVMSESDVSRTIQSFHHSLLSDALDDGSRAAERVAYHYTRSLHGFAARLTQQEKNNLAGIEGVVSIHETKVYRPQTTRSWSFLGLPEQKQTTTSLPIEQDVIIGVLDTGISMDSLSFSDVGLGPPPAKWKGRCSKTVNCNNKIIGAWAYYGGQPDGEESPTDYEGHGTHVASTAAGRAVEGVSLYGLANGTARGAVPGARLAVYKVCWNSWGGDTCTSEDILAAMDDAIADGVDVISASIAIGTASETEHMESEYYDDALAIGAFHAMRKGVLTSVPAGNCGPKLGTVANVAPWMISVAATTTDRKIVTKVVLGNNKQLLGNSVNTFPNIGKPSLLMDPGSCDGKLDGERYKGAILLCASWENMAEFLVYRSGAAGVIVVNTHPDTSLSFPAVFVTEAQFDEILDYYNSSSAPEASIFNSRAVFDPEAPLVPAFSSRGPNMITPGILKPDISAPGVDILGAWSNYSTLSSGLDDDRQVLFNIMSGTSMASPHITGAAAYVKSLHPDWSPAAIMSSLITTATPILSNISEAEFAYGAGLVNPVGAVDPGLVYDASEADYISFLCSQGYNSTQIPSLTGTNATCPWKPTGSAAELNYPSMAIPVVNYGVPFSTTFTRRVTNVAPVGSVYNVSVIGSALPGITITVEPSKLAFSAPKETLNFTVTVSGLLATDPGALGASSSIVWSDGMHEVRSPVYVFPTTFRSYVDPVNCRCKKECPDDE